MILFQADDMFRPLF